MQPKSLWAPKEIKRTVTVATLNNSSTQHPADGQHTPGGLCTGAIFFQNIQKEKSEYAFKYKENYLTNCTFVFRDRTFAAQMSWSNEHLCFVRKRNQYFSYHCLQCLFSKAKQQFGRNSEGCVENTLSTVHTNKLFQISPCLKMSLCVIKSDLPGNAIHRSNY